MLDYKKDEYVQYGMCPVFTIWTNRGSCITGHMIIKKSDSKEIISQRLTELVKKFCKEEKLSDEQTLKHINDNLKSNGLCN